MNPSRSGLRIFLALALAAGIAGNALAGAARAGDAQTGSQKKKAQANEKSPQYQYEKGLIALRYGLPDEAIRYGKLAVSLDPEHFNAWNLLGSAYYTKGEYALSAESYGKAAVLKPDAGDVQRNLGLALVELKETEKAEAALKKSYDLNGDAEAAYYLSRLYNIEKRYEEALDYVVKSIQKNGANAGAYNLKGAVLNQLDRPLEAVGCFQAGLVLAPDDVNLQVNLGVAFLNAKEPAKAMAVFEAVLPKIEQAVLKTQVENYIKAIKDAGK
jgi:tetratricopeptide (TPR) repeat protein